ncbi:MAG TPA: hypothetical protein PLR64_02285 [Candidatus Dojkabacteria bacterium]|nr:hypothetical protein [Candidatus Dojkabacteria bacterium]
MSLRKDLLSKGKEALEAIKLPFKIRSERKTLEQWILEKETRIAELEYKIQEAKGNDEIKVDGILDMIDELDLLKRRLKQGQELMVELYSNEE